MIITKTIRAIVFARNCKDSHSFFVPKTEYRSRSPPENFGFRIHKFKKLRRKTECITIKKKAEKE